MRARRLLGGLKRRARVVTAALRDDDAELVRLVRFDRLSDVDRRRAGVAALRSDRLVVEFERDGTVWTVPSGDEIFDEMVVFGSYEAAELDGVLAYLDAHHGIGAARGTVVDVGANVGTTTIPLVRAGFDVVAVEPVSGTRMILEANLARNGLADRVVVVAAAVSDGSSATMSLPSAGTAEVVRPDTDPAHPTEQVPCGGLVDLVVAAGVDPAGIRFVWADTQGSEFHVVRSGSELWSGGVPLFAEVWPAALRHGGHLEEFVAEVRDRFDGFVTRDDLVADGADARRRPIVDFADFVASIADYSDALLLPRRR